MANSCPMIQRKGTTAAWDIDLVTCEGDLSYTGTEEVRAYFWDGSDKANPYSFILSDQIEWSEDKKSLHFNVNPPDIEPCPFGPSYLTFELPAEDGPPTELGTLLFTVRSGRA